MSHIQAQLIDHCDVLLFSKDGGIYNDLNNHLSFLAPNYKYNPKYKKGVWDGYIRLVTKGRVGVGLWPRVQEICKTYGHTLEVVPSPVHGCPLDKDSVHPSAFVDFIKTLSLPHVPHDFQYKTALDSIRDRRKLIISPTGSGKSLIAYMLTRWVVDKQHGKVLVVVPSINLLNQIVNDFAEYGYDIGNHVLKIHDENDSHTVEYADVVVTTWQSVYRRPQEWFAPFTCVIGDEAHSFQAKSLHTLMSKCGNAMYRFGLTGTLDGTKVHQLVLESMFGPVTHTSSTKELQDRSILAPCEIKVLLVHHTDEHKRQCENMIRMQKLEHTKAKAYRLQLEFIAQIEARNKLIANLANDISGKTIILFRFKQHGKTIRQLLEDTTDRNVYYFDGTVESSKRESMRQQIEADPTALVVASYGTFSAGINIKTIDSVIFASPYKSTIKVLQSIGRALRYVEGKSATVYDIVDDLSNDDQSNYAIQHGISRNQIYNKQQFPVTHYEVNL